jgi:hypothetical protein
MRAVRYVQKLHEVLTEVAESGGNRALFVIMDHDLVAKLKEYAYTYLKRQGTLTRSYEYDGGPSFITDLMSRDTFNSRIRYCVAKLQEFSIPPADQFEFISQAIAAHVNNRFASHSNFALTDSTRRASVSDALVIELTNCFQPWYRPDDIFLLDFATEHCLCSRNVQKRQWRLTALGRYILELPSLETVVTVLAAEVALSHHLQNRFVSLPLLRALHSSQRQRCAPLPYSLRMFDLVGVNELADEREDFSTNRDAVLTPLGKRVLEILLQSEGRLRELILVMLESEVEGVRALPKTDETETQAIINGAGLLELDDKQTLNHAVAAANQGEYVVAVRILVPLMERVVDAAIAGAKLQNPGVGLTKKCGVLVSEGVLSRETASYVEIVTARNKVAHGTIGRNDHSLLKPLFVLSFNYLGQLIREVENGVARLARTDDATGSS